MNLKRQIAYLACLALFLSSCVTPGGEFSNVGPKLSSLLDQSPETEARTVHVGPKLDVIIPVFDPGITANLLENENSAGSQVAADSAEGELVAEFQSTGSQQDVWPELRRAEATKFALMMKRILEDTGAFGAIRVAPDQNSTGDLYVLGKISESNGEDVEIEVKVVDISGKTWLDSSYDHRVTEKFYTSVRNKGKNAYQTVFDEAAQDIVETLKGRNAGDLEKLKDVTDIRFAASFSDSEFGKYLKKEEGFEVVLVRRTGRQPG